MQNKILLHFFRRLESAIILFSVRIFAKVGISKIEKIFTLSSDKQLGLSGLTLRAEILSASETRHLADRESLSISEEDICRIIQRKVICIVAYDNDIFAGIGWYAIQPYHHSSGLIAEFDTEWICGYGVYIVPVYRKQGARAVIIKKALEYANSNGRRGILAAIDLDNRASIYSGIKLGYQSAGYSFWFPGNRFLLNPRYRLRFASHEDRPESLSKTAVITPFISPILDTALATGSLYAVIGCQFSTQKRNIMAKITNRLRVWTGRDTDLENWCERRKVPYLTYSNENLAHVGAFLKDNDIDILVSYAAPILPAAIFDQVNKLSINIHPSPLPAYRGGNPLFWQVFNGESEGGITLHKITAGVDKGNIILQRHYTFPNKANKYQLLIQARAQASRVFIDYIWGQLAGDSFVDVVQPESSPTSYAGNTTLGNLLKDYPFESMPIQQAKRLYYYLGYWPALLTPGIVDKPWMTIKVIDIQENHSGKNQGLQQLSGSRYRYYVDSGYFELERKINYKKLIKSALTGFRYESFHPKDISL
jgi:methionyl-tRNA formyltransferase